MKLSFYGAAGEVTGSSYLVETDRARVLVDFGMFQGGPEAARHNRRTPPFDPTRLSAMVLTHAHIDHCGRIPMLVRAGFHGRIHATPATCELTEILLEDAAKLQEADAGRATRRRNAAGKGPVFPLYTSEDVPPVMRLMTVLGYDQRREIAPGVWIRFVDAGHILGSASVEMTVREAGVERVIAFSGDIGEAGAPLLRDPVGLEKADVVVMESTYGDRDHRDRSSTIEELADVLIAAKAHNGKVLIPAFAVGRTQTLIYHIGELVRAGRLRTPAVYIDSPMGVEATDLYRRHREVFDEESWAIINAGFSPLNFPGLTLTRTVQESKRLNAIKDGIVVIAASGMCTGGRIVHHLANSLGDESTHVVIAGYQAQGSPGRKLVDGAKAVRMEGQMVGVRAKIHTMGGFSAHAGQTSLMKWASHFKARPGRMFLTHGEDRARGVLAAKLLAELGITAQLPMWGDSETL